MEKQLHKAPFNGTNCRKKTKARRIEISKTQSIPVYEMKRRSAGLGIYYEIPVRLIGYKYIHH
jgi:hypothetical protein